MVSLRPKLLALLCTFIGAAAASSQTNLTRLGEFKVNRTSDSDQRNPVIASDFDGNFVVVWNSQGQDGSGLGVYAQKYLPDGTPYNSEIPVNSYTEGDQGAPSVAKTADGRFVV